MALYRRPRALLAPRRNYLGAFLALLCSAGVLPVVLTTVASSRTGAAIIGSSPSTVGDLYTIAGTGAAGNAGSGVQATTAALSGAVAVATDGSGDVFIS